MRKDNIQKISTYTILYLFTFFIVWSVFIFTPNNNYQFPILRNIIIFFSSILLGKYFLYMFVSPWYDVWFAIINSKYDNKIKKYKPHVSVMIPAWNEEIGILTTVKSLLQSEYRNLELVIVNDGSTDNSEVITSTSTCNAMKTYIKKGRKNNVAEVTRLQTFLNQNLGLKISSTGFYGNKTFDAVRTFQLKYKDTILTPWGIGYSTGYFYKTTQRQMNMLLCPNVNFPMPVLN